MGGDGGGGRNIVWGEKRRRRRLAGAKNAGRRNHRKSLKTIENQRKTTPNHPWTHSDSLGLTGTHFGFTWIHFGTKTSNTTTTKDQGHARTRTRARAGGLNTKKSSGGHTHAVNIESSRLHTPNLRYAYLGIWVYGYMGIWVYGYV